MVGRRPDALWVRERTVKFFAELADLEFVEGIEEGVEAGGVVGLPFPSVAADVDEGGGLGGGHAAASLSIASASSCRTTDAMERYSLAALAAIQSYVDWSRRVATCGAHWRVAPARRSSQ
jgi:hypothetical protein